MAFSLPKTTNITSVWGHGFTRLGEHDDFQRYEITGPGWQSLPAGASTTIQGMMKLTFSGGPRFFDLNGFASSFEAAPGNRAPVARAGADATYRVPADVTLNGGDSFDPDGDVISYQWSQLSGMPVTLLGDDTATPTFSVAGVDVAMDLVFELTVGDGELQAGDQVAITLEPAAANNPPTADAGADTSYDAPVTVTLDGSGSSDPDGDLLDYQWMQTGGPTVSLTQPNNITTQFDTKNVQQTTVFTFELTVDDGEYSDSASVSITAMPTGQNRPAGG